MTLATLKGMNFNMAEVANAFKLKTADSVMTGAQKVSEQRRTRAQRDFRRRGHEQGRRPEERQEADKPPAGIVDPLQWWGALTQQFQQIAARP